MSDYKRFFSYVYAYENSTKTTNSGFAKIETRGEKTDIELHMQRLNIGQGTASLYLFVCRGEKIRGIFICDIPFQNHTINWHVSLQTNHIGETDHTLSDISGIVIKIGERIAYISQWDETAVDWDSFYVNESEMDEPSNSTTVEDDSLKSEELSEQSDSVLSITNIATPAMNPTIMINPIPVCEADEDDVLQKLWENFKSRYLQVHPFEDQGITALKIELKELKEFPQSNWHLISNRFLLRGFFTYRYLLFWQTQENGRKKWLIGVPGIFRREEHVLANIFGFHDFISDTKRQTKENPFGYWYRTMDEEC